MGLEALGVLAPAAAAVAAYCAVRAVVRAPGAAGRLDALARPEGRTRTSRSSPSSPRFRAMALAAAARLRPLAPRFVAVGAGAGDEARAALAGSGLDPIDVHLLAAAGGLAAVLALALASAARWVRPSGWLPALIAVAAVAGPRVWTRGVVARHRANVARELPKVADLLTLGAESGLELLPATEMASRLSPGPVGTALRAALDEARAGREVIEALRAVPSRTGGQAVTAFIASVVQGLELGTPVARILRAQADGLRAGRRQALEARIAALSMRLTLITILFFVPALLVIAVLPNLLAFLGGVW